MEAPTPIILNEKEINEINFLKEDFCSKINNDEYIIKIGTLKEFLVIKVYNQNEIKNSFISYFNYEQLRNISKSLRYFDDINDIIKFLEEKGKKNEILLKKQNNNIYLKFIIISPNGNQDNVSLEIKSEEISDKEIISNLIKKIEYLEKEVELLKEKLNKSENIISKNKSDILSLFEEIRLLKNEKNQNNKIENNKIENNKIENNKKENNKILFDSKISNINEIDFIINELKESPIFNNKNIQFKLLYR